MSVEATIWAWTANVSKSSERLVLLSLADRADEQNRCYPSMERVAKDTLLDIKTVKKVIADLIEKGFILDTGERKGLTQKVRVLQLVCVKNRENQQENEPKNGTVKQTQKRNDSKNGMNPILPTNEPKIGSLNEPKIGSQNLPLESNNESIQTNTREAGKTEQAIIDGLTSEPKNFEMYFGWKPNQQEFLAYKKSYGVTQDLTPEILEEFIRKAHANKEKHNETKWCNFLAKFLKSWINNPTFEKKSNPHIYQPELASNSEPYRPNVTVLPVEPKISQETRMKNIASLKAAMGY